MTTMTLREQEIYNNRVRSDCSDCVYLSGARQRADFASCNIYIQTGGTVRRDCPYPERPQRVEASTRIRKVGR